MTGESGELGDPLSEAAEAVQSRRPFRPLVGVILGSGLGEFADQLESADTLSFADVPHHPLASVEGHAGQIRLGWLEGIALAIWRGRLHYYEGHSMADVAFPIRLLHRLGGQIAILTNAAGGLSETLTAGDLMLIADHISLPSLVGHGPLRGTYLGEPAERFVDLSEAYDADLRQLAMTAAGRLNLSLAQGVYAMVAGPNYETQAEGRLLRMLGADAVGMSTVPEVIAARQLGLRALAISAITNAVLRPADGAGTSHADVLAQAERLKPRFDALLRGILIELRMVLAS